MKRQTRKETAKRRKKEKSKEHANSCISSLNIERYCIYNHLPCLKIRNDPQFTTFHQI